jgi:signal transduction histidine kinase
MSSVVPESHRSLSSRGEWLIGSTRLALAAFSLFALAVHPIKPDSLGSLRLAVVSLYGVYAAALARMISRSTVPLPYSSITHVLDVSACFLFLSVSPGIAILFVPFFAFAVVTASLRWQWRGVLWTSTAILSFLIAMGAYTTLAGYPGFEIHDFLLDTAALAVTAGMIGRIGVQERRARQNMEELATEPAVTSEMDTLLSGLVQWAATILGAPRALIAWEDPDEPWLYLAWADGDGFHYAQEPPGRMAPIVPEELAGANFLCNDVMTVRPIVICQLPDGSNRWRGMPLHPALQAHFTPRSILSVRLAPDVLQGRLFVFDKPRLSMEDLALAEVVSRHMAIRLTHLHRLRGLAAEADKTVRDERLQLARDLHDGALHSLAGLALELESLLQMPTFEQAATHRRVEEVQQSLLEEQRNIRQLIAQLRADSRNRANTETILADRLEELACRLKRQWGLQVQCVLEGLDSLPPRRSNEVYLIVHEALINAARHANAPNARVEVAVGAGHVTIVVADNGRGFEFKGRYDLAALAQLNVGPATLKERVALLGGALTIESTEGGTRVEISLGAKEPVAA